MEQVSSSEANIDVLIDAVNMEHQPALIMGKGGNAVLIAEDDWRGIEETLFLESIPGMSDSIIEGMNEPIETCSTKLEWE